MSLQLYYLPLRARAEPIRMILAYGGVAYEDYTISMEEWAKIKADRALAPFGQLPSMKIPDGSVIAESGAIIRLVAKLAKLYPEDPYAAAKADMVFEFAVELNMVNPLLNFWPVSTEAWQTNFSSYFFNLPNHLALAQDLLGESDFYGGSAPHYGDFALFHILDACVTVKSDSLDGFAKLQAFVERMQSLPALANYLSIRPAPAEVGLCGSFMQIHVAKAYSHQA